MVFRLFLIERRGFFHQGIRARGDVMEEFKQNPLFPGLNGFSPFWSHRIFVFGEHAKGLFHTLGLRKRVIAGIFVVLVLLAALEIKTSFFQARFFTWSAGHAHFVLEAGENPSISFPSVGPYDQRLGFTRMPVWIGNLIASGYRIEAQARSSLGMRIVAALGLNPPYREKTQAGLSIFDAEGETLFEARYPERICPRFEFLSPLVIDTLLFIENRELLDIRYAHRNPAVEWDRLAKAVLDRMIHIFDPDHPFAGGSTLPTQIEKFRHSPDGRTTGAIEKLKQMASASLKAYRQGPDTQAFRRQTVVDYLNSVPFAAVPGYGEVHGIADALWVVYGVDFNDINTLLLSARTHPGAANALAYKQILSLFIAQRRPSHYLAGHRDALEADTNAHLRLLCRAGIIPPDLRDKALDAKLHFLDQPPRRPAVSFIDRKAANIARRELSSLFKVPLLYNLDRLDLSVRTTLNQMAQIRINQALLRLRDPKYTTQAGLHGYHLLGHGDPSRILYSFTLYEHVGSANLLRIQTDNLDQPLDINEGIKMELGSTAKLRTLVTYLELIAHLHKRYSGEASAKLRMIRVDPHDRLTRWALDYLASNRNQSLTAMLQAAMERRYPADPHETFYTGGGRHKFHNFDPEDDGRILTVGEAFRKSVNLVFIRLMRDIVHHITCSKVGSMAEILEKENHPSRLEFLKRFADYEGRVFLHRFYSKYRGKTAEEQLGILIQSMRPSPVRLAAAHRFIHPSASIDDFAAFLRKNLPWLSLTRKDINRLYLQYAPGTWSLPDRGSLSRLHPLELWLVAYLKAHPGAGLAEVLAASAAERQAIYQWLFKPGKKSAQNTRIRMIMEVDAFADICASWKKTGYPFATLIPSYATAIGSSADRPSALAELIGIILNQGVRYPHVKIETLHFAAQTPYETVFRRKDATGQRVLPPETAFVLRNALMDTVERGTAQAIRHAFIASDGLPLKVGGKTGTGDNRHEVYDSSGQVVESRVMNRAAVFAFFIGNRFYGTITALVLGPEAAGYDYTSSLPVRILKIMSPKLLPMIEQAESRARTAQQAAGAI